MRVTDDDLRKLLVRPAAGREACPAAETLAAAAAGELADDARETVLEHVARCGDCAEELRALASLTPWAQAAAAALEPARAGTDAPPPLWGRRWPVWVAAAVVALGLPLAWWAQRTPAPHSMRAQPSPAIRSLLPESAALPRARSLLRWTEVAPGARYSVRVLSKDLRPLAGAEGLERPEYLVPAEALQSVPPGGEIVWSVEARSRDGLRVASPTFINRLD
jgi:hypothetical protein